MDTAYICDSFGWKELTDGFFTPDEDYRNIDEWMLDSDYRLVDGEWFDFETKYLTGSRFTIPAELSPELTRKIQEYSLRTFTALPDSRGRAASRRCPCPVSCANG